jgi:mRNA-degrading endonuclease RelE of RelBE toxin-antitoxin system
MTYSIVWLPGAMTAYRRMRGADPAGAKRMASAIGELASEPRPESSNALGQTSFRRLRLDNYRVLYEVTEETVFVMHVGRVHG